MGIQALSEMLQKENFLQRSAQTDIFFLSHTRDGFFSLEKEQGPASHPLDENECQSNKRILKCFLKL